MNFSLDQGVKFQNSTSSFRGDAGTTSFFFFLNFKHIYYARYQQIHAGSQDGAPPCMLTNIIVTVIKYFTMLLV